MMIGVGRIDEIVAFEGQIEGGSLVSVAIAEHSDWVAFLLVGCRQLRARVHDLIGVTIGVSIELVWVVLQRGRRTRRCVHHVVGGRYRRGARGVLAVAIVVGVVALVVGRIIGLADADEGQRRLGLR